MEVLGGRGCGCEGARSRSYRKGPYPVWREPFPLKKGRLWSAQPRNHTFLVVSCYLLGQENILTPHPQSVQFNQHFLSAPMCQVLCQVLKTTLFSPFALVSLTVYWEDLLMKSLLRPLRSPWPCLLRWSGWKGGTGICLKT